MYRDLAIAVVIPAYNESGYVGKVIESLPPLVDRAYVVDDGSTDDTWAEIQHHAETMNDHHDGPFEDRVVPIRHDANRGVGGAIKTGYRRALDDGVDATAVLGGDDQMDAAELPRYLDPIADGVAGYAKGNRFTQAEDWATMPRFRLVGNVLLSYLTKIASGYWGIMDSQNGYTAISADALDRTEFEDMFEYYGYCNDLLVRLNVADVTVADVPRGSAYAYADGWKSHIDYGEYIPRVSLMLVEAFLWRLFRKHVLQDYHPLVGFYLLGSVGSVVSGLGLMVSVVGRVREDTAGWVLAMLVSLLAVFHAIELDRAENESLVVREPREDLPLAPVDDDVDDDGPRRSPPASSTAANTHPTLDQS